MRFMMLMIPKGYEKASPGEAPDAKAVAARHSTDARSRAAHCESQDRTRLAARAFTAA